MRRERGNGERQRACARLGRRRLLVVAAEEVDAGRITKLQDEQEHHGLDAADAAVDVVA